MNDQTTCPLAHSDAAYVLGALSPAERLEYERHLPTCAACRRSVAQLAGIPGLLGRVPVESVEEPVVAEPVPSTVLPALVARVRREQRRKTVLLTLGAAAAVAAVAVGAAALQSARDDDSRVPEAAATSVSPTVAPALPMSVVVDYGMCAKGSLTPVHWGTKLSVSCDYAEPEDGHGGHGYDYRLVVFTRDGHSETAMSWYAEPGDSYEDMLGATSVELQDITKLEVQSERGNPILKLEL
jgi:hypothetical protein